jgi:hypothetical protein
MTTEQQSPQPSWQDARAACKGITERERLGEVIKEGWRALEFAEYARCCHRRPGKDYATPGAYRKAMQCHRTGAALQWRRSFREQGSKPLPPRSTQELRWPPGLCGIDQESPLWPFHPKGFVEMIAQRSRQYFDIGPNTELHPNTWTASCRAYWRELSKNERLERKAARLARKRARELQTVFQTDLQSSVVQ